MNHDFIYNIIQNNIKEDKIILDIKLSLKYYKNEQLINTINKYATTHNKIITLVLIFMI